MKKSLALLCIIFTLIALISPANAEDKQSHIQLEDSSHISQEILDLLPLKDGDQVIRIYDTILCESFYLCSNIDELLYTDNDCSVFVIYIVKSTDGTYAHYRIADGKCSAWGNHPEYRKIMDVYLDGTVVNNLDPNIIVENSYYLSGRGYIAGDAIYYRTNLGDYVYYQKSNEEFILSIEAFCEYQAAELNYQLDNGDTVAGSGSAPYLDLSQYKIGSPVFNPNAPFPSPTQKADSDNPLWLIGGICISVILVGASTVFIILRQRKRKFPA